MPTSALYDHAALALPPDASDVADMPLGAGDTVRVEYTTADAFRTLRRFTGTVVSVDTELALIRVKYVDSFSNIEREWPFFAEFVQLLVKADAEEENKS